MTEQELNQTLIDGVEDGRLIAVESERGEAQFYLPHQIDESDNRRRVSADELRQSINTDSSVN